MTVTDNHATDRAAVRDTMGPEHRKALNAGMAIANIIGLSMLPAGLENAVNHYDAALAAKRQADIAHETAKAAYDDAVADAELEAGLGVTREGNRTFVADGDTPRQVTADEARAWVARQVAADATVAAARRDYDTARLALEEARDNLAVADRRITATKHSTDASVALARLLTAVLEKAGA